MIRRPPRSTRTDTLLPYTTLFRSGQADAVGGRRQDVGHVHPLEVGAAPHRQAVRGQPRSTPGPVGSQTGVGVRSEEHTSELQSLMRISYAVFCLKKKKYIKKSTTT